MKTHLLTAIAICAASCLPLRAAADNMKAFPAAEEGMTRYVLNLPKLDEEPAFKVELIIGKTVEVDPANRYFFGGKIESETIKGWGFTRYIMRELGPMGGTLRASITQQPKEERFVTIGGDPYLIRYNSRLPLVVYVPKGVEVKYRVWSAGERTLVMDPG
jgi:ecotin